MKSFTLAVVCFVGLLGSGFAQDSKTTVKAVAYLTGDPGVVGNITFTQSSCTSPVLVEISIAGLTVGKHGFHIHEKGDLRGGCGSTGSHYNPDKVSVF